MRIQGNLDLKKLIYNYSFNNTNIIRVIAKTKSYHEMKILIFESKMIHQM